MFERFTRPARTVVESAASYAQQAAAVETRPEHLLQGILGQEDCLAVRVLADAGAPADRLRARLAGLQQQYVDGLDDDDAEALRVIGIDLGEVVRRIERLGARPPGRTQPRFSRGAKKVLELSLREALAMRHNYIGTEHILLGLARADDRVVSDALRAFGLDGPALRDTVARALRRAG
jgi:ATP-dependent Clp protease ATP-binding subunit ClpA